MKAQQLLKIFKELKFSQKILDPVDPYFFETQVLCLDI